MSDQREASVASTRRSLTDQNQVCTVLLKSVLLHGSETWPLGTEDIQRLTGSESVIIVLPEHGGKILSVFVRIGLDYGSQSSSVKTGIDFG